MSLDVYLHGERVGGLFQSDERNYSFAYRPDLVDELRPGALLLSNSLPLRAEPFGPDASRVYIEGLLPQGARRQAIAAELDLDPDDGYGLIAEIGEDCLGAVSFVAEGESIESPEEDEVAWLSEAELHELLRTPPRRIFDPEQPRRMRFALPGERHKLALCRDEESGRWAWPQAGLPSTHIVKPEPRERPGMAVVEHTCTLAYRELGIPVVHTAIETIGGRPCLVSKRFDRWVDGPEIERLHQESFTQALGIAPDSTDGRLKAGTPMLNEASGLLRAIGEEASVFSLMKATFCDLILGNTKLRGGDAALLVGEGEQMLAPFYGIASTEIYGDVRPQPIVIGVDVPPAPLLINLQHTIELCGVEPQPALLESLKTMGELCRALGAIAEEAWQERWTHVAVEEALQTATGRSLRFQEEAMYLRPPGAE